MKAVILPTLKIENFKPLTNWTPEYLLKVTNKTIIEHQIEYLVRYGIREIFLAIKHMPFETESFLGVGRKWGCNITFSLIKDYSGIISSLQNLGSKLHEDFLCLPGNILFDLDLTKCFDIFDRSKSDLLIFKNKNQFSDSLHYLPAQKKGPFLPFISSPLGLELLIKYFNKYPEIDNHIFAKTKEIKVKSHCLAFEYVSISNFRDYQKANFVVLNNLNNGFFLPAREIQPSIRIGKRSQIHPKVELGTNILVGDNCRIKSGVQIKENSIIGDNVLIDSGTIIENSVVLSNTYIGSHMEISNAVVEKNMMYKVPQSLYVFITDDFILGDMNKNLFLKKIERLYNLFLGLFLLLLFSPLIGLLFLYHLMHRSKKYFQSLERFGDYKIVDLNGTKKPRIFKLYTFNSPKRLINKLPGLMNVVLGDLNLVGNSPQDRQEALKEKEEWEIPRHEAPVGLFHIWEAEGTLEMSLEEKSIAETYYAMNRSFWGDVRIFFKSFLS